MFEKKAVHVAEKASSMTASHIQTTQEAEETYAEMKIGKVAQSVMRPILESGRLPDSEVLQLQSKEYCNEILNLNFPLLVKADAEYDKARYYSQPVHVWLKIAVSTKKVNRYSSHQVRSDALY